jgi:hypothetical protein
VARPCGGDRPRVSAPGFLIAGWKSVP